MDKGEHVETTFSGVFVSFFAFNSTKLRNNEDPMSLIKMSEEFNVPEVSMETRRMFAASRSMFGTLADFLQRANNHSVD